MPLASRLRSGLVILGLLGVVTGGVISKVYSNKRAALIKDSDLITSMQYKKEINEIERKMRVMEIENIIGKSVTGRNLLYSDPILNAKYEKLKEEYFDLTELFDKLKDNDFYGFLGDGLVHFSTGLLLLKFPRK